MPSRGLELAKTFVAVLTLCALGSWPLQGRADEPAPALPDDVSETREPAEGEADVLDEIEPDVPALEAPSDIEQIEVTGTRLPDNFTGVGPITTLTPEDVELSGGASTQDLLQEIPSLDFTGSLATDVNGGRGRNTIGLRGLGPSRSLILLNGTRMVNSSNGAADAVDIFGIPPQLLAGVDILRDGVSTIYGSDAVAGVVNFRLFRGYEGLELNLTGGISEEADGSFGGVTGLWGKNFSRGNITLAANFAGNEPIKITDRSFSRSPINQAVRGPDGVAVFDRDIFSLPQGVTGLQALIGDPNGNPVQSLGTVAIAGFEPDGGSSFTLLDPADPNLNDNVNAVFGRNINDTFFLTGEGYRSSGVALFTYELLDSVVWESEVYYSRVDVKQRFSPTFIGGGGTTKNPGGFTFNVFRPDGPNADLNNPFLPEDFVDLLFQAADARPEGQEGTSPVAFVPLTLSRGLDEFGPRVFQGELRTFRAVNTLRGSIPAPIDDFEWKVYFNYGRTDNVFAVENEANLTRALASVQPAVCAQTPGCVVGDFFGSDSLLDTPGAFAFVREKQKDRLRFHLRQFGIEGSTSILQLPAGNLRLAIGGEYREEDGFVAPDPAIVAGDTAGLSREPTRGRQLIREAFFEADIPLLEGFAGFQELSVNVSGRYTDYSSFGGRYLSRYAVNWAPVDSLRLRGIYSTSFRSPGISDLFLGNADSFVGVIDRCAGFPLLPEPLNSNCAAQLPQDTFTPDNPFQVDNFGTQRQVRANIGGNMDLQEETATSVTAGFVYNPGFLSGAVLSADYYEITVKNPIQGQSAQFRVDSCLVAGISSECDALQRSAQGGLTFVDIPITNFGEFRTNGIDFGAQYGTSFPYLGLVGFSAEAVYIFDFEVQTTGGEGKANGTIGGAQGGTQNMKARFTTFMQPTEKLSLSLSAVYLGEAEIVERKILDLPFDNVPDTTYVNVGMNYQISEALNLFLGVQNATDKQPPLVIGNNVSNTNRLYDVVGRTYSVSFNARF